MPTYTATVAKPYVNLEGVTIIVGAGQSFETYIQYDDDNLTLTDEAPYFNPANEVTAVTLNGSDDETIELSIGTDGIEVYNDSEATVTIYLESDENLPGILVFPGSIRTIMGLKNTITTVILSSTVAGTCTVTELK